MRTLYDDGRRVSTEEIQDPFHTRMQKPVVPTKLYRLRDVWLAGTREEVRVEAPMMHAPAAAHP